jgi:hypothetical protein
MDTMMQVEASTESLTPDQIEGELVRLETMIARIRAAQIRLVARAVEVEMPRMDGARSLVDWVAARADVSRDTALDIARMVRGADIHDLELEDVSFDRAVVRRRLIEAGAPKETVADSDRFDIAGVRRLAARHRRVRRTDEQRAVNERALVFEESFDTNVMRFWGRLPGVDGRKVREALDALGDTIPRDAAPTRQQRMADALVMLAQGDEPEVRPVATVIVDARIAAPTDGEAGVAVVSGPTAGADALEAILCHGVTEVVAVTADGTPLGAGTASRKVPPKLRRFVLARDGGCIVDGCTSTYRLQTHHLVPASQGGTTEAHNLAAYCWHHHHRVIHGLGYRIHRTATGRIRLKRPPPEPP